eukprot:8523094-Heterocapsa_arctica.AAC.1
MMTPLHTLLSLLVWSWALLSAHGPKSSARGFCLQPSWTRGHSVRRRSSPGSSGRTSEAGGRRSR